MFGFLWLFYYEMEDCNCLVEEQVKDFIFLFFFKVELYWLFGQKESK